MASLKADLDSYLGKKDSSSPSLSKLTGVVGNFSLPSLKSPFSNGTSNSSPTEDEEALLAEENDANSW